MIILGLDPGSRNFGWAILQSAKDKPIFIKGGSFYLEDSFIGDRLSFLFKELRSIICTNSVNGISIEIPELRGANAKDIYYTCGLSYLLSSLHSIPLRGYGPRTVKQAITGSGKADKKEVAAALFKEVVLPENYAFAKDHESDAAAIAYTYLYNTYD
jgi:crossover junction endodeoxyribonuclease RuvC